MIRCTRPGTVTKNGLSAFLESEEINDEKGSRSSLIGFGAGRLVVAQPDSRPYVLLWRSGIGELRMPQKAKAGEAIEVYVNVFVTDQARGKRKPLTERYTSVVLRYQLGDGPPHTLYPSGRMPKEDGNGAYYQFIIPPYSKGELEVEASWVLDGKAKSLRGRVELS